jgi:hypothetical protein
MESNQKAVAPKQIYILTTSKNYPKSDKLAEHITNYINFNRLKTIIDESLMNSIDVLSGFNTELTP